MTDGITCARLRVADPARWRATALAWRELAGRTGRWAAEFGPHTERLRAAWSGAAAVAAGARLQMLRRRLTLARLSWWEADQALCEFAAGVDRAKAMLSVAISTAERSGLIVDADGRVHPGPGILARAEVTAGRGAGGGTGGGAGAGGGVFVERIALARAAAVEKAVAGIEAALAAAARADTVAAGRLAELAAVSVVLAGSPAPALVPTPACSAAPAEVRNWWDTLDPAQRRWLVAVEPEVIGPLDGVPVAFRDLANRLRLETIRDDVGRDITAARDAGDLRRLRRLRSGLDALADRLADGTGLRAYLMRVDLADDGRAVVAVGDPDGADNVLTHVPGMTADLMSLDGEIDRAVRVAARAQQLAPGEATSAVTWLDYDAPDFVHEAGGAGRAEAGAVTLRRFQEGLTATHDGPPAHRTLLGHSYGSLVVGSAAGDPGLAADSVVFVGSPGVGVDAAAHLHALPGQVWSTTSRTDAIQYLPVAPGGLLADVAVASLLPPVGAVLAYGGPEEELWFGRNPSDPGFGARIFESQASAGHLGYWDPGHPALDNLARITLGGTYQEQVTPP